MIANTSVLRLTLSVLIVSQFWLHPMASEAAQIDERVVISSDSAPKAIGPYSQAIQVGKLVFLSGQIALDPSGQTDLSTLDIQAQTRQAINNLVAVLAAADLSISDVASTTLYLTDLKDFDAVNKIYASYFRDKPPARATIQVAGLPRGAKMEISAIAVSK